jgi:hypothetical protein
MYRLVTDWRVRESNRGTRFSALDQNCPGAHPATYAIGIVSYVGVKMPGRGFEHTNTSNAQVTEGVELYIFSPSGPSWSVVG